MPDDLTSVNVAESALVAFIERVAVTGGSDIKVSQGDKGWYVTYRPPFTRDIKEDGALVIEEAETPEEFKRLKKYPQFEMDSCEECNIFLSCIARYDIDRTNWKCAKGKVHLNFTEVQDAPLCSAQERAEADCDGDRTKCGDVCHAKSNKKND